MIPIGLIAKLQLLTAVGIAILFTAIAIFSISAKYGTVQQSRNTTPKQAPARQSNMPAVELLNSDQDPPIISAEFRPMDIIDRREFATTYQRIRAEVGTTVCWLTLVAAGPESVNVHLCNDKTGVGDQIGRIAKRHIQYANAYVADGPVCGLGRVHVDNYNNVEIRLGDPTWRGF